MSRTRECDWSALLYLRMVALHCYGRAEKDLCYAGSQYRRGGLEVPAVDSHWALSIVANCSGRAIQSSRRRVDYFAVPDVRPVQPYRGWDHPNAKPIGLMPLPLQPQKLKARQLCRDRKLTPSFAEPPPNSGGGGGDGQETSASSSSLPINVNSAEGYAILGDIAVTLLLLAFLAWRCWSRRGRSSSPSRPKAKYAAKSAQHFKESISLQVNPAVGRSSYNRAAMRNWA